MVDWLKENCLFILVGYLLVSGVTKAACIVTGCGFSAFGIVLSHDELLGCLTSFDVLAMLFSGWVSRSDRKASDMVWRSLVFYSGELVKKVEEKRQRLLSEERQRKGFPLP